MIDKRRAIIDKATSARRAIIDKITAERRVFVEKANESLKVATLAYENECYNSYVNRVYYGAYQKILALFVGEVLPFNPDHHSSHENTLDCFKNRYHGTKNFYTIFSGIKSLKEKRKQADYKDVSMTREICDTIKSQQVQICSFLDQLLVTQKSQRGG